MVNLDITFDNLPINNISILLLIISGNYLGELFPCKFQKSLSSNVYLKHVLGYMTMVFFVTLNDKLAGASLARTFVNSLILYLIFMIVIKSHIVFLYIIFGILMVIYLLTIQIDILEEQEKETVSIKRLKTTRKILKIILLAVIPIGFLLYLGEKKLEYKKNFSYMTFLFGKSVCKAETPTRNILKSAKALFNMK